MYIFIFCILFAPLLAAQETAPAAETSQTGEFFLKKEETALVKKTASIEKKIDEDPTLSPTPGHTGPLPQRFRSPYDAMANMPHDIREFEHASGNWLGFRDQFDSHGVEFSVTYTSAATTVLKQK